MKKIMKTVQSSYLHLYNILSSWVEFSSRVIESSFSTRLECLSSTSQLNSTLFQKKIQLDSTFFESSTRLELKYSTQRDQFNSTSKDKNNIREFIKSMKTYNHWIARRSIAYSVCIHSKSINRIYDKESSWIARELNRSRELQ